MSNFSLKLQCHKQRFYNSSYLIHISQSEALTSPSQLELNVPLNCFFFVFLFIIFSFKRILPFFPPPIVEQKELYFLANILRDKDFVDLQQTLTCTIQYGYFDTSSYVIFFYKATNKRKILKVTLTVFSSGCILIGFGVPINDYICKI